MTLLELAEQFPDDQAARDWFERLRWDGQRQCGHCQSENTKAVPKEKPMPYWCSDCKKYFSVRTGTPMAASNLPLKKWAWAFYLMTVHPKGVSSIQMAKHLGVSQKTAWFLMHKVRECWDLPTEPAEGPVEVDETYVGGLNKNRHGKKKLWNANGTVGKTHVIGLRDSATGKVRAKVIHTPNQETLSGFVNANVGPEALVYTDEHSGYDWVTNPHEVVKHSQKEYVRGDIHTNSIESFWAILKRSYKGVYHYMSPKHLDRYVREIAGRYNARRLDTLEQMRLLALGMVGKKLEWKDLVTEEERAG